MHWHFENQASHKEDMPTLHVTCQKNCRIKEAGLQSNQLQLVGGKLGLSASLTSFVLSPPSDV